MDLLDNEKYIFDNDPNKIIDIVFDFPNQFKRAEKIIRGIKFNFKKKYSNALVLGIGNTANIAFKLLDDISTNILQIPIIFSSKNIIPTWVGKDTLVVAISHSGDTLEVIEAVEEVLKLGIDILVITTGGKLKTMAQHNEKITLIEYETSIKSRMALGYIYVLLVNILNKAGVISIPCATEECQIGINWDDIEKAIFEYSRKIGPDVKTYKNIAKRTAINLFQNIPIIYGCTRITETVSYRLKNQICLNSKNFAHYNTIPEIDHGEIAIWDMRRELRDKFFVVFILEDNLDEETMLRIDILKGILIEKRINFEEIVLKGENDAVRCFKGIYLADWISIYLAILNKVEPYSIYLVDSMKKRLDYFAAHKDAKPSIPKI